MNEENKTKPVMLSDEEMDKIAGGRAIVISKINEVLSNIDICKLENKHPMELEAYLKNGLSCGDWVTNGGMRTDKVCQNCIYHQFYPSADKHMVNEIIFSLSGKGYGIRYIE